MRKLPLIDDPSKETTLEMKKAASKWFTRIASKRLIKKTKIFFFHTRIHENLIHTKNEK